MSNIQESHSHNLFFDPQQHPDNTLQFFIQFTQQFQLRYAAQFPDPPKASLDSALQRWRIQNITSEALNPTPTLEQYDELVANWQAKDKVAKFLGMFSSMNFHDDWLAAQPEETLRKNAGWTDLVGYMTEYYKLAENITLNNFHFHALTQSEGQTFSDFCDEVEEEAKRNFKCHHDDCTAEATAVRDQIVCGTSNEKIREEALMKRWDLVNLRKEGMRMESELQQQQQRQAAVELSDDSPETPNPITCFNCENINRQEPYSHKNENTRNTPTTLKPLTCFNCGTTVTTPIRYHIQRDCPALGKICAKCNNTGHFEQFCKKLPRYSGGANQLKVLQQKPTKTKNY